MHISLTPELEKIIKEKVASGLYNNVSEVVREALRFMKTNEELVYQMKLDSLRMKLPTACVIWKPVVKRNWGRKILGLFFRS